MEDPLSIRRYKPGDAEALAALFHAAVHRGAAGAYTPEQRAAWSPAPPGAAAWHARLSRGLTLVAERGGRPAGFMTLVPRAGPEAEGCIDLAFVAPEEMGRGVAGRLHDAILAAARARGMSRLMTEASLLARPFFARRGWRVLWVQQVERGGVPLENALMDLSLGPDPGCEAGPPAAQP